MSSKLLLCVVSGWVPWRIPLSGTFGTIQALAIYLLIGAATGSRPPDYIIILLAAFWTFVSFILEPWAKRYARSTGHKKPDDPTFFVIDEWAGFFVTAAFMPVYEPVWWLPLAGAFILFRFFDILKPFPIQRLEHLRGGVVWDDLLAGVYANLCLQIGLKILTF